MQTFLFTLIALFTVTAIMAVGVILGRKPIKGSCGGVGAALGQDDYICEFCEGDEAKCEELKAADLNGALSSSSSPSFYKLGS